MKRRLVIPISMLAVLAAIILGSGTFRTSDIELISAEIRPAPFQVWSVYEGELESRSLQNIMSQLGGPTTITEMVPEGTKVTKDDVLVRFDSSQLERDVLKLDRDCALARADLEGLEKAKLPLELRDLESKLADARAQLESEKQFLEDNRALLKQELISEQELKQQETKVAAAGALVESLQMQVDLTRQYLHPSALQRARATLASAEQELNMGRENLQNCVIKAPSDGLVVYRPVHVGGEFRTVRIGDTIFRNMPFMTLPDMRDPVVQCDVPEAELSRVSVGREVIVVPVSYGDLRLKGTVESVGSMAQSLGGHPEWQRFFHVVIGLKDTDPRLRPGMSVRALVLSYSNDSALLVPRTAVRWENEKPYCELVGRWHKARRDVKLGMGNDQYFEVLDGLETGDRVMVQ